MSHLTGPRQLHLPKLLPLLLTTLCSVLVMACGGSDSPKSAGQPAMHKITFMAAYKPQANLPFVGAYVAQEKGFFRQEGLEVDIKHDVANQSLQLLEAGEVQFTTADASDILKRIAD